MYINVFVYNKKKHYPLHLWGIIIHERWSYVAKISQQSAKGKLSAESWLMKFKAYTSVLCDVFLLMFISCRSQQYCVEHEADVEIPGQDEMSEETLHYSLPRLPHHLPPLSEPLH